MAFCPKSANEMVGVNSLQITVGIKVHSGDPFAYAYRSARLHR